MKLKPADTWCYLRVQLGRKLHVLHVLDLRTWFTASWVNRCCIHSIKVKWRLWTIHLIVTLLAHQRMDAKLLLAVSSVVFVQLIAPIAPQEETRGVHIGKDVTVGQPGYNNGHQGSGVHVGKEVTIGQQPYQPGYQQPYQNQYQPAGTYGGQYHNSNNSPPPTSTHPQLGPCVNNGKLPPRPSDCSDGKINLPLDRIPLLQ